MASILASEQPLAVCVDASTWSKYTGGIVTADSIGCTSSYWNQDHCVQAVGFASIDSDSGYWCVHTT
jgi:hypothetical protein